MTDKDKGSIISRTSDPDQLAHGQFLRKRSKTWALKGE